MAMIGKIRRMYFREKKSVREISRLTSLSRNTIDKWLKAPVTGGSNTPTAATPARSST
jgi:transposase-like protein